MHVAWVDVVRIIRVVVHVTRVVFDTRVRGIE